jgi:hypothetical protein
MGPHGGDPFELLEDWQDPKYTYIVGVLFPRIAEVAPDPDQDAEPLGEDDTDEDSEVDTHPPAAASLVSPSLNPKGNAASFGISALAASSGAPRISLCATWARYQDVGGNWKRVPDYEIISSIDVSQDRQQLLSRDGVRIFMRSISTPTPSGPAWRVSIFFVNETKLPGEKERRNPPTQSLIFQPELRLVGEEGTSFIAMRRQTANLGEDERSLELLFRNRGAHARGHICSAIWASVDPQVPYDDEPNLTRAPYAWVDAKIVPEGERPEFEAATHAGNGGPKGEPFVRTSYLPLYAIEGPAITWPAEQQYQPPPVLSAELLAESFDPPGLEQKLGPLAAGYETWIHERTAMIPSLPAGLQETAKSHIEKQNAALARMREGIRILRDDVDARLAFCFMNKVMDTQARWSRDDKSALSWHPFQLAFILQSLPALANEESPDRKMLDLLWFPTGGGKTEAYLGLATFSLALRRRRAITSKDAAKGGGVGVLSRYTLRLLTIQQFRRALAAITAMDMLRVVGFGTAKTTGWRPQGYNGKEMWTWGGTRFSLGLWAGGEVTPNRLKEIPRIVNGKYSPKPGAIDLILGNGSSRKERSGEPAQVLTCPCCHHTLAIPETGLETNARAQIDLVVRGGTPGTFNPSAFQRPDVTIASVTGPAALATGYSVVSIDFTYTGMTELKPKDLDEWLDAAVAKSLGPTAGISVRPSRSGYFIVYAPSRTGPVGEPNDFEIICSNPKCDLRNVTWVEEVPKAAPMTMGVTSTGSFEPVVPPFRGAQPHQMRGMPISGFVVDDQVYARCPSMVIATVDKFARLAFDPQAGALFGNITHYHAQHGYYREGAIPKQPNEGEISAHPPNDSLRVAVAPFRPPDLIIQDELHLIEGPLGTMVGLYETAVDNLATFRRPDGKLVPPKYVASTATIREARSQVQALFARDISQFPPPGLDADNSFFARTRETHARNGRRAGRLYLGLAAPGKGGQTPVVRIWSLLLQRVNELRQTSAFTDAQLDWYWTLVGYFNAIKELANAAALARQDIPGRIQDTLARVSTLAPRDIDARIELSSRMESYQLPALLEKLKTRLSPGPAIDALLTTSMFGTGVDIDRLSLMVVHSQPKTTAAYIQATGRVGRKEAGLVVSFLRAGRARDLDHYEYFVGYHRALHRSVEPVTVSPYAPRARERGLGPVTVALLRNARHIRGVPVSPLWAHEQKKSGVYVSAARRMASNRADPEVKAAEALFEDRAGTQPHGRKPPVGETLNEAKSWVDRWEQEAARALTPDDLVYVEYSLQGPPSHNVVLGDPDHLVSTSLRWVFKNAPQSLRDVEAATRYGVW